MFSAGIVKATTFLRCYVVVPVVVLVFVVVVVFAGNVERG